jgi:hypothetical protein
MEVQFGHVAHAHHLRELVAQLRRQFLQALDRFLRLLGQQRGDEHLRVRHVARDFHVRHAH